MTRRIRRAGNEMTKVVAFEPFPGNHPFFLETTSDLTNIQLVKKAVSNVVGTASFVVDSTVRGTEPGWETLRGYSSVGYLLSSAPPRGALTEWLRRTIQSLVKNCLIRLRISSSTLLRVETTTIDHVFPTEEIDFMKIDVQGAELQVLLGASKLLSKNNIGLLYIEWSGDTQVIDLLTKHEYRVFDSNYVGCPRDDDIRLFEEIGFRVIGRANLSTGRNAYHMVLPGKGGAVTDVLRMVKERRLGWVQTDLIAVSRKMVDAFTRAVRS